MSRTLLILLGITAVLLCIASLLMLSGSFWCYWNAIGYGEFQHEIWNSRGSTLFTGAMFSIIGVCSCGFCIATLSQIRGANNAN